MDDCLLLLHRIPRVRLRYAPDLQVRTESEWRFWFERNSFTLVLPVFFCFFRIRRDEVYDVVTPSATIAKGVAIAIFFAVRFFHQRRGRVLLSGEEEPLLGPDARYVPT